MTTISANSAIRRRGLSALEMVLALPILLFIMAFMINYGSFASWKIRGLSVARTAVWSTRWPRAGGADPRPAYWPQLPAATMGVSAPPNDPVLDDPRVNQPVARGPLPFGTMVDAELLNPSRGFREGDASLTREYPMLKRWGSYTLKAKTQIVDDLWQYERTKLSSNFQRRVPAIYSLAKAPPQLVTDYIQAYLAIIRAPFRHDLDPLDRDNEYVLYGAIYHWGSAPDFHPRLRGFCSLDRDIADKQAQDLVDRIAGKKDGIIRVPSVAENMAHGFIDLYQRVIRELQKMAPPDQGQINQLQQKIDTLNQFLQTL